MIKKIFINEFDLSNLSLKKTVPVDSGLSKVEYKGVVVEKPWGYEYLMFENAFVAIWILFLKFQSSTSMHCHPKKKTSLLVLDGKVKTSSLDSTFLLRELDGLIIESGVFHSTSGMASEGAFIMEIETPPQKDDLVRLKDEYGRENSPYESGKSISSNLNNYDCLHFYSSPKKNEGIKKLIKDKTIMICHTTTPDELFDKIKSNKGMVFASLNYKLMNKSGEVFLETGDIINVVDLLPKLDQVTIHNKDLISLFIGS